MANFRQTYVGGQSVKAADVIVGPIVGVVFEQSVWEIETIEGAGAAGTYVYEASDSPDDSFAPVSSHSADGNYSETRGELYQRIRLTVPPDPGTTVRVTLSGVTVDEATR